LEGGGRQQAEETEVVKQVEGRVEVLTLVYEESVFVCLGMALFVNMLFNILIGMSGNTCSFETCSVITDVFGVVTLTNY